MTDQQKINMDEPFWKTRKTVAYDRKKLARELAKKGVTLREAAIAVSVNEQYFYSGYYRGGGINVVLALRLQKLYGIDPLTYVIGADRAFFESWDPKDLPKMTRSPKLPRKPDVRSLMGLSKKERYARMRPQKDERLTNAQIRSGNEYRKKCKRCIYRCSGDNGCDYILLVGHSRGCLADQCTRFVPGPQLKQKQKSLSQL